jgi:hypothetical protein
MTMPHPTPESLHEAVHKALLASDFDTARHLSAKLGQAIIRQASVMPPAERADYVRQGLSRLQEHLSLARVLRAHLATQVQANSAVCLYHQASDRGNAWRFDA